MPARPRFSRNDGSGFAASISPRRAAAFCLCGVARCVQKGGRPVTPAETRPRTGRSCVLPVAPLGLVRAGSRAQGGRPRRRNRVCFSPSIRFVLECTL